MKTVPILHILNLAEKIKYYDKRDVRDYLPYLEKHLLVSVYLPK